MLRALLFDLDGTLVDTEPQTTASITEVMSREGHAGVRLPPNETCGRSWADIACRLCSLFDVATPLPQLAEDLLQAWNRLVSAQVTPLLGVREALLEAQRVGFTMGVVSSSPRSAIDSILNTLAFSGFIPLSARIGADDVRRYKPDPEGYLLGAERLGVSPHECLVFEDSSSGLRAARAAGMLSVGVLQVSYESALCRDLADASLSQYKSLPPGFFEELFHTKTPRLDLQRLLS
jgi:HAD superfamily hydrolase (TIGR01509 family)